MGRQGSRWPNGAVGGLQDEEYLDTSVAVVDAQVGKGKLFVYGPEIRIAASRTAPSSFCSKAFTTAVRRT